MKEITAVFLLTGLDQGRCFGSKSAYREAHCPNRFVPNASIYVSPIGPTALRGKIWFGDLDLLRDGRALASVSRHLRRKLFVLTEADSRWVRRDLSHREVVECAVATIWRGQVRYSGPIEPHGGSWW